MVLILKKLFKKVRQFFSFKYRKDYRLMCSLHPVLAGLFVGYMVPWLMSRGVDPVVTRTVDKIIRGVSETNIHADCRAMDIRTRDWPKGMAKACEIRFNLLFAEKYGAVSSKNGERVFAVYHEGTAEHLHIQVLRGLPYDALLQDWSEWNSY